jgi:hypothetical protein
VLISPLNMLPVCINGLVEALVSVRRVQRYLAAPEVCYHLQHMPTRLFSCGDLLIRSRFLFESIAVAATCHVCRAPTGLIWVPCAQSKGQWAYSSAAEQLMGERSGGGDDSNSGRRRNSLNVAAGTEQGSGAPPSSASSDSAADGGSGRHGSPAPYQPPDGLTNGFDSGPAAAAQPRMSVDVQGTGAAKPGRLQSQSSLSAALALAAQQTPTPPGSAAGKQGSQPAWKRTDVRISAATFQWSRPDAVSDSMARPGAGASS